MNLEEYQTLITRLVKARGYDTETIPEVFLLLTEEVGELAKAIRKYQGMKVSTDSKKHDIEEEIADVFWLLLDLCNRLEIDLAKAFDEKEAKNANRTIE